MVIVIALVIGLLCSSLVAVAYFYRLQYQKSNRYESLQNNLGSGINILLANSDTSFLNEKIFSLYGCNADSVSLQKISWGVFDIGVVKAFTQKDTLCKIFSIGNTVDSAKWAALYLSDKQRPLSVSGKTMIKGNAYIPKAGIKATYVDNESYEGDKDLIIGKVKNSNKELPELSTDKLNYLESCFKQYKQGDSTLLNIDSITASFLLPTHVFSLGKKICMLKNIKIAGNIIIYSDTTLIIDSTATLNHIMVFAQSIIVKEGFKGNCQLFALDSIGVEKNCQFNYPSCLGILRLQVSNILTPQLIDIGENTIFNGLLFINKKVKSNLQPLIQLRKNVRIFGQIYVDGLLESDDGTEIDGSVFVDRFIYKTNITLYENYLVNVKLDASALSPYYLTSEMLPVASKKRKILEWLEK